MPRVVVVGVSIDLEIPRNELPEQFSPVLKVVSPVDNRFVPCRRQRFHAFAVSKPTNADEISRYPIKLLVFSFVGRKIKDGFASSTVCFSDSVAHQQVWEQVTDFPRRDLTESPNDS